MMQSRPRFIFHLVWLPSRRMFALWAEDLNASVVGLPTGRRAYTQNHPFALSGSELVKWASDHLTVDFISTYTLLEIPGYNDYPQPSPLAQRYGLHGAPQPQARLYWQVPVLFLKSVDIINVLLSFPPEDPAHFLYDSDLVYWQQIAYRLLHQLRDERYVPEVVTHYSYDHNARWNWWMTVHLFERFRQALPPSAISVININEYSELSELEAGDMLYDAISVMMDGFIRNHARPQKFKFLTDTRSTVNRTMNYGKAKVLLKTWEKWLEDLPSVPPPYRLILRLYEPETSDLPWRITFGLQSEDDSSLLIEAAEIWRDGEAYDHLQNLLPQPRIFLMRQLATAADHSIILNTNINDMHPASVELQPEDAYRFLVEDAPALEEAGFKVLVPDWWQQQKKLKIRSQLQSMGESLGMLSKDSLFSYRWQIALGDDVQLSREEFEQLVSLKQPLVQHQGRWVALDERQIAAAQSFFKQQSTEEGNINLFQAFHASVDAKRALASAKHEDAIDIEAPQVAKEVEKTFKKLRNHQRSKKVNPPKGLQATLRPYQLRGFQWLVSMREMGLGVCLADDMGLGKTIQTIALWVYERERLKVEAPALLVCPTSVVGNWHQEIRHFAPDLRVIDHHGPNRLQDDAFTEAIKQADVVLTSYALLPRDLKQLQAVTWDSITLDEAQNIKNPATKQAQAARSLNANFKLALTGTPIENRLSELWSLFRFLNPGYLGARQTFQSRFGTPIEKHNDKQAGQALRQLVAPFILRRVKTDPKVIQDLPDKFENRVFCNLTPEQATLYEAIVRRELDNIAQAQSEMERRGAVLRMLVHLKQVCNHPAQYLKQATIQGRNSGKLQRLTELLTEVREQGERALIFTQYAQMGRLLQGYIKQLLGEEVLFLHGGTPGVRRAAMVEQFQQADGPPVFVLSLKAGGTGLNLTAATQVFHFDRWYNPAVEDQATDRAYRIGQQQVVQVHKFICIGTLEERIDALITRKREIADQVIGSGEGWISELSDSELRELVTLRTEAVG